MKILGIDPGYAIVGFGIVEHIGNRFRVIDYGSIKTKAGLPSVERLQIIYNELRLLIYKNKPDCMAIEKLFFNTNVKTAIGVAQARGVRLRGAANEGLEIAEYTPLQIKQAVTGYGRRCV